MALDSYEPCTCGSGKKFKWCCQPIFAGINRAWDQEAAGQHEVALRLMEEVVREHGGNPEAWGQKARLLASQGKVEEAEKALQKAFDLNPNYPAGLLLRASIRFQEGEVRRRAAAGAPRRRGVRSERAIVSGRGVFHHLRVRNADESAGGRARRSAPGDALRARRGGSTQVVRLAVRLRRPPARRGAARVLLPQSPQSDRSETRRLGPCLAKRRYARV